MIAEFAQHFNKPPDQLGAEEIRRYRLFLLNEKRVELSSYIQAVCALRFFYRNTLHRRIEIDRIDGIGLGCKGPGVCDQTVKLIWAIFGLAPAAMFVTGAMMWWNRVLRRKRKLSSDF